MEKNTKVGRPSVNPYNLFAVILFNFAFGKGTLRDIEERCRYDLRCIYLLENDIISHVTISKFINKVIVPNYDVIFHSITKEIIKECQINSDDVFIDGSKFEANANKYKFVYKPTTFHNKLSDKIRNLLEEYDLSKHLPKKGIISSKVIANCITLFDEKIQSLSCTEKERKMHEKKLVLLSEYLAKSLEYEEKENKCGPNRNSYYKTDIDATAMTLKSDYYSGLGSNTRAAYNVQLCVSRGVIVSFYLSQNRSDINDFISSIEKYYKFYNTYPKNVCADAGYGNFENYSYLKMKNIGNYVKHQSWEGNVSGRNPRQFNINKNNEIICLNGKIAHEVPSKERRSRYLNSKFFKIDGCNNCEYMLFCKRYQKNKDEDFKIFEIVEEYHKMIFETEERLLSAKGIELRVNRSSQVEGAFGVIKQDIDYTRFRRRNLDKVSCEFALVCLGYNIRKLFKYYEGKGKFDYWKAPENLKSEIRKKISVKRLINRVNRKKTKSANEVAKKTHRTKKGTE